MYTAGPIGARRPAVMNLRGNGASTVDSFSDRFCPIALPPDREDRPIAIQTRQNGHARS